MAKKINSDRQWEIEDAMRTLQRANTIQADRKLMTEVKQHHNSLSKMLKGGPVKSTKKK